MTVANYSHSDVNAQFNSFIFSIRDKESTPEPQLRKESKPLTPKIFDIKYQDLISLKKELAQNAQKATFLRSASSQDPTSRLIEMQKQLEELLISGAKSEIPQAQYAIAIALQNRELHPKVLENRLGDKRVSKMKELALSYEYAKQAADQGYGPAALLVARMLSSNLDDNHQYFLPLDLTNDQRDQLSRSYYILAAEAGESKAAEEYIANSIDGFGYMQKLEEKEDLTDLLGKAIHYIKKGYTNLFYDAFSLIHECHVEAKAFQAELAKLYDEHENELSEILLSDIQALKSEVRVSCS